MTDQQQEDEILQYGGHINQDQTLREKKARKIETILSKHVTLADCDVLDLGAGSGLLSAYLKPRVRSITAADREPEAFLAKGIDVVHTPDTNLPFEAASFDVVVFNHVIEHVGQRPDQDRILAQIHRVLRPGGILYLAVPNRWALIEPHYRLPFLSWLPQGTADRWVRARGMNDWYDCNPYAYSELIRSLRNAGFRTEDATAEAFFHVVEIERSNTLSGRILARTPRILVENLKALMPTLIVIASAR